MKDRRVQVVPAIFIGLIAFWTVARGPRFDQFRTVDIVLLMGTGMCFGAALYALLSRRRE